jgi:hypothetical protein
LPISLAAWTYPTWRFHYLVGREEPGQAPDQALARQVDLALGMIGGAGPRPGVSTQAL